jgi:hypothetical protein
VESEPAGIDCGSACKAEYNSGAEVTLIASPAPGSAFAGWSGACAGAGACTVTMSEARSVGAEFEVAPLLALESGAEPDTGSPPDVALATPAAPISESTSSALGPSVSTSAHRHHHHHRRRHRRRGRAR